MSDRWHPLYNGGSEARFYFRPAEPESKIRTENWEADNPPHVVFVRLECECRETHTDQQRVIEDAMRSLMAK